MPDDTLPDPGGYEVDTEADVSDPTQLEDWDYTRHSDAIASDPLTDNMED